MKTNKMLVLATAAAIIAGGLLTSSFATESSPATTATAATPLRGMMLKRIAEKLNLTDGQKSQIKTILGAEKDTLAPLLGQLHNARKNLRAAIRASDANEAAVRAASATVAAAEANLAVERMKFYGKIAPILTDAQRQQIAGLGQRADEFADNAIAQLGEGLAQ